MNPIKFLRSQLTRPNRESIEGKQANRCQADIVLSNIQMAYGERRVLDGLSSSFPRGKISVILGDSGIGKSTILRLMAGLVKPTAGSIEICGQDITRFSERALRSLRANVGMMFQNGALLDSLSVQENLAFPLREHAKLSEQLIAKRVEECLASVGLSGVGELLPGQLSGGMVKRVALARAMILRPDVLLCDEPFSGLDPLSVKRIESLLLGVNRDLDVTMVVVSHDVGTTLRMADHIVILLADGVFAGSPDELRHLSDARLRNFLDMGDRAVGDDQRHALGCAPHWPKPLQMSIPQGKKAGADQSAKGPAETTFPNRGRGSCEA